MQGCCSHRRSGHTDSGGGRGLAPNVWRAPAVGRPV